MLRIEVKKGKIDAALKAYKRKFVAFFYMSQLMILYHFFLYYFKFYLLFLRLERNTDILFGFCLKSKIATITIKFSFI